MWLQVNPQEWPFNWRQVDTSKILSACVNICPKTDTQSTCLSHFIVSAFKFKQLVYAWGVMLLCKMCTSHEVVGLSPFPRQLLSVPRRNRTIFNSALFPTVNLLSSLCTREIRAKSETRLYVMIAFGEEAFVFLGFHRTHTSIQAHTKENGNTPIEKTLKHTVS